MDDQPHSLVLVIENKEPLVRLMTWSLTDAGFKTIVADSPSDATRLIREHEPQVVVFNTDLSPDVRAEVTAAWRLERPQLKILHVELTGAVAPPRAPGLDAVVRTPFDSDALTDAVRQLASANG